MTMNPSLFWVEPDEFSRLLERAGANDTRGPRPARTSPPAWPAESTPPFSPAAISSSTNGALSTSSSTPDYRPQAPQVQPPEEALLPPIGLPSPSTVSSTSLEEKFIVLFDWIRSVADFDHAFVVDEDGLALVHESAPLELIAASSTMAETWDSLRNRFDLAGGNFLTVRLMDGQNLHLQSKTTRWGRLSLGIVLQNQLSEDILDSIHSQFQLTLEEQEHNQS